MISIATPTFLSMKIELNKKINKEVFLAFWGSVFNGAYFVKSIKLI